MSAAWAEIACQVPAELVDQLASFLVELSGTGVCIDNQTLDTFSLEDLAESPVMTVKAYLPTDQELDRKVAKITDYLSFLANAHSDFHPTPPVISFVRQEEWATSWKQHFHPLLIGRHLVLKPSWEEFAATPDQIVIELDPGMAFGTGTHPTTRLCLECLERIFNHTPPFTAAFPTPSPSVLDVGTGSGILAIAARKLGAGRVIAIDVDPEAVTVALSNLAHNAVTDDLEVSTTPLSMVGGSYSVILANILAEELIRLAPDLTARLEPGGILILSGILTEKEGAVTAAYNRHPLTQTEVTRLDEWSCLVYCQG